MAPPAKLLALCLAILCLHGDASPRSRSWRASVALRGGQGDEEVEITPELQELVDDMKEALAGVGEAAVEVMEEELLQEEESGQVEESAEASATETRQIQIEEEEPEEALAPEKPEGTEEMAMEETVVEGEEDAAEEEETETQLEDSQQTEHVELNPRKINIDVGALAQFKPGVATALLSGGQFAIGDILAQKLLIGRRRISLAQCSRLSVFGVLLSPLLYRLVTSSFAGKTAIEIVKRIAIDELVLVPIMLLLYFAYTGVTMGHSAQEVVEKVEVHLPQAVMTSWVLLPLAQVLDHHIKGDKQRLISASVVMVTFAAYLSYIGSKAL